MTTVFGKFTTKEETWNETYEIDFDCENLEVIGVPKAPGDLHHDPRAEVSFYHCEMRRILAEN